MRTCLQCLWFLTTSGFQATAVSTIVNAPCVLVEDLRGIISRSGLSGPKVKSILFYIYLFSCVGS